MVPEVGQWPWSSHRAVIGQARPPGWLETDWLLAQFAPARGEVVRLYAKFVGEGLNSTSPWKALKHQMILGDDEFVVKFRAARRQEQLSEIPKTPRRPLAKSLEEYRATYSREEAMARAYLSGAYTMKEIADFFTVHYMTVSRAVRNHEQRRMLE